MPVLPRPWSCRRRSFSSGISATGRVFRFKSMTKSSLQGRMHPSSGTVTESSEVSGTEVGLGRRGRVTKLLGLVVAGVSTPVLKAGKSWWVRPRPVKAWKEKLLLATVVGGGGMGWISRAAECVLCRFSAAGEMAERPLFLVLVGLAWSWGHRFLRYGDCWIFRDMEDDGEEEWEGEEGPSLAGISGFGAIGRYLDRISAVFEVVAAEL